MGGTIEYDEKKTEIREKNGYPPCVIQKNVV